MEKLKNRIRQLLEGGICIAFSGGVDSSLLLKIACEEAINFPVHAVTFETKLHPSTDLGIAKKIADEVGAIHHVIELNEFENEKILQNPIDRCYLCKKDLFVELRKYADSLGLNNIVDGTNYDDLNAYRPGIRALKELNIISPLAELKIDKSQVREFARKLGLSVSNRPSAPCLATRLPYGTRLDPKILEMIDSGELFLKSLGFNENRIRLHNDIARIELPVTDFDSFIKNQKIITAKLKELGFIYITLDVEGFRSGSMDIYINTD